MLAGTSFSRTECEATQQISPAMHAELQKLRPDEVEMRQKWTDDESGWHKLPPRAWPPVQPKPEELAELKKQAKSAIAPMHVKFDLATCLTFNNIDPVEGLRCAIADDLIPLCA